MTASHVPNGRPAPRTVDAPSTEVDPAATPVLRRLGPGGSDQGPADRLLAADHAFGVALVTLWHRLTGHTATAGFPQGIDRGDIARLVPPLVDELRTGRVLGYGVTVGRHLVGVGLLRPGRGSATHTGALVLLLTDPDHLRTGVGGRILDALLQAAPDHGIDRVEVAVDDESAGFFRARGFTEWGRRPGWRRPGPGSAAARDEVLLGWTS